MTRTARCTGGLILRTIALLSLAVDASGQFVLWDDESLVTHPGAGAGGADVSMAHDCLQGLNTALPCTRVLDKIVVTDPVGWQVDTIRVYAYVTNSGLPSPVTEVVVAVWDADPATDPNAAIVHGDVTTNVLIATSWTGAYRVSFAGTLSVSSFPIMFVDADMGGVTLASGTYWFEWGFETSLGDAQSVLNPGLTGHAQQYLRCGPNPFYFPADPTVHGCSPGTHQDDLPMIVYGALLGNIGVNYCPALPNSSGLRAAIEATGLPLAGTVVTLTASSLPANHFGYFLAGRQQGLFSPPGSQGQLCLSGNIGRFNAVAQIGYSGSNGSFSVDVDTNLVPVNPPTPIAAGESWNFQAWFRDDNPGPTSNFTDGMSVVFQ